jgi:hypothetical protein
VSDPEHDFPKVVPLYPGAVSEMAIKPNNPQGKRVWTLTLRTADAPDKVVAYYKANMPTFQLASGSQEAGPTVGGLWKSPQYDVSMLASNVLFRSAGDKTTTIDIGVIGK